MNTETRDKIVSAVLITLGIIIVAGIVYLDFTDFPVPPKNNEPVIVIIIK